MWQLHSGGFSPRRKARARHERRFDHEVVKLTTARQLAANWQNVAFERLAEAVEITAIQRGAERWRP
jgi:hypothetical protein